MRPLAVKTVSEEALGSLRKAITKGTFRPGQRLVERQVAARLGVSTIAVREAYARLLEEGLVVRIPRRGTFVAKLSPDEVRDLAAIRNVLEEFAVERIVSRWTPSAHQDVLAIIARMQVAAKARDRRGMFKLDQDFHDALWRIADSKTLLAVISNLRSRVVRLFAVAADSLTDDELQNIPRSHQRWLDAIASGDVVRAKNEVTHQLRNSSEEIVRRMLAGEGIVGGIGV
jgi:DNA-binding GntR family transcriptional regulator